jgi:outer membrane protein assembly factor BamC
MISKNLNRPLNTFLKTGFCFVILTNLSACSSLFGNDGYFRDRGDDYLKAIELDGTKLPEGTDPEVVQSMFVVPEIRNAGEYELLAGERFEVPRPQPLAANMLSEKVKIQKLSNQRWILINTPASEAWPRIRNFLSSNGLQLALVDAEGGVIETAWLKFVADDETRHRYRLRIEQGVQPDSTEIHVLHAKQSVDLELSANVPWPDNSEDLEKESWMIDELAGALASEENAGATSLLAQTIGGGAKVEFSKDGREPILLMDLATSRAWATIGHSVKNGGFKLFDENSGKRIYYITFVTPEEESGWFDNLWGGDDKDVAESPYSLDQVLANLQLEDNDSNRKLFPEGVPSSDEAGKIESVPGLLVLINELDGRVEVRIRDAQARTLEPSQTKRLLTVLRRNLI